MHSAEGAMTVALIEESISAGRDPNGLAVREAHSSDNAQLVELASCCPMRGEMTLRIDRSPDFFALHRLEGDDSRLGVVERGGEIAGCISVSRRLSYLNGVETITGYAGDLKVHPDHRDTRVADALCRYATEFCAQLPAGAPTLITVLAGNTAMERRLSGPRGLPRFEKIATIRTHSISVLWKRKLRDQTQISVAAARWTDLEEMSALWRRVAPFRQLAPVYDADGMAGMIHSSPGLDISSYLLARSRDGRLLGFIAIWDQSAMKRLFVDAYSTRMQLVRHCFNFVAPLVGGESLPASGQPLLHRTVFQTCVPSETPDVLRVLLVHAHNQLRGSKCSFFNIGLDTRDPLTHATEGLLPQATDVNAYVSSVHGPLDIGSLRSQPLHYEIALV
jgi:ribosomal protein S18 acetylase RimI-like enzyme